MGLGTCGLCGEDAVVAVNGRRACTAHLDDVFAAATAPLRAFLDLARPDTEEA